MFGQVFSTGSPETCPKQGRFFAEEAGFSLPLKDTGRFSKSGQVFYGNHGRLEQAEIARNNYS